MADITQALEQAEIADSILSDDNIIGSWKSDALAETPAAREQETSAESGEKLADLSTDRNDGEQLSPEEAYIQLAAQVRANGPAPEQQASQPVELTATQVRESMQSREAFIQEHQLNDPLSAKEFALGMTEAFGGGAMNVNIEQLGLTSALVTDSAALVHEKIGPQFEQFAASVFQGNSGPMVPAATVNEFFGRFIRSCNQDPRVWEGRVDKQLLADTVFFCDANIIDGAKKNPGISDPSQLNDPRVSQWAYGRLLAAFGYDPEQMRQADPEQFLTNALTLADARARYVLSFIGKHEQNRPRVSARPKQNSGSPFRTNQDIFTNDVMERRALETATRKSDGDFSPKGKAPHSPFQTNQDIFDDETMSAFRRL